jgi:iron complex outermembrane recepter protein
MAQAGHATRGIASLAAVMTVLSATVLSAHADPQQVPQAASGQQRSDNDELDEIVVTGSRIARPDDERPQPTTIISSEFLELRGYTNVIDALNELPAFGEPKNSLVGPQTSEGVGQSFANLFSLGAIRTLTLVDGLRFVSSASPSINGPLGGSGEQVDLNVIPTQLIDRVEIISAGGAPIYGSDAIAGTVNIILKHDYQGVQIDAEGGLAGFGDAGEYRARGLAGKNFADGRGNVTLDVEYAKSDGLLQSQRPRTAEDLAYLSPAGPSPYEFVLDSNMRLPNFYSAGGIPLVDDGYLGANPNFAIRNSAGQALAFNGGHFVPYNIGNVTPGGFAAIGGDGLDLASISPLLNPSERINATALGNFQLTEQARFFAEGWYSETHNSTLGDLITPDSAVPGIPAGQQGGNLIMPVDNPFLTAADQAIIAKNLAAYAAANPINPQQTSHFYLSRTNFDIGNGTSWANQYTRRVVLGLDGTLPILGSDYKYEVAGTYGETRNFSATPQLNWNNFQNALNAIVGPGGKIICNPYQSNGRPIVNSPLPTESSTCAPFNPFGNGIATPAAYAYVTSLGTEDSLLTQRDFNASINGPLFSLPAGAVKAAVGYENRRDSAAYAANAFFAQGDSFYSPLGPVSGAYVTNEVFGELLVPLIGPRQNLPWAHRLELEAAAREVDHSFAGKATTWTAGLRFEPVGTLQLRSNYTHSILAPSVTDAFLPAEPTSTTAEDPCDQTQIKSGPNPAVRAANCAKAGITQPFNSSVLYNPAPSVYVGNPNLTVETANARSIGFVWRPAAQVKLTVDYVQIDISQVIDSIDATQVLDGCYDGESYPNAYCNKFTRSSGGQVTFIQTGYANIGFLEFAGVQSNFEWSFDVPWASTPGALGEMDLRINEFFLNKENYDFGTGQLYVNAGEIGYSKHKGVVDLNWHRQHLYALWQARFTGPALFNNQVPANQSAISGVGTWWVNDVTLGYRVDSHLKMQLVVDNVFGKQAPFPLPAAPGYSDYFAYFNGLQGRYFKALVSYTF